MEILFNWNDQRWEGNTGSDLFEELCYDLLKALNYTNLKWRTGGGDKGRDIECEFFRLEPDDSHIVEKWFCECKRYNAGVNVKDLQTKIAWADADKPEVILFIVSSYLTTDTKDWIKKIEKDKKYRIKYWERKDLEDLIQKHHEKIPKIDKYFLAIEDDLNELYKKFYRNQQLLKERKLEKIKILENSLASINDLLKLKDIADKYKELAQIKKDLKEFNQAIDDLKKAREFYQQLDDKEAVFNIILMKGDTELEQNWGIYASETYKEAYNFAKKENNPAWMGISKFKSGQAYHYTYNLNNYSRSLNDYQEALKKCPEIAHDINIGIAELYLDFGKYNEFEKIKDILDTTNKESFIKRNFLIIRSLLEYRNWDKAKELLEETKTCIDKPNLQSLLDVSMIKAYIEWKKANYDNAIAILKNECIPLVTDLQDEEKLMVIYQNISHLKQERNSVKSQFDMDFWAEHTKWVDISNRLEKKYEKAQLRALYAEEKINKGEFSAAYENLQQSKRFFRELNSWTGEHLINEKHALLALHTGNLKSALEHYIVIADLKKVADICKELIIQYDKTYFYQLVSNLLNVKNSPPKEQVSICLVLGKLADVIPEELVTPTINKLLQFIRLNHTKKEALLALQEFNQRSTQYCISEIIAEILSLITCQDENWQIREAAVELLNKLSHNIPERDQISVIEKLCTQFDIEVQKEHQRFKSVVSSIEVALANIGKHSADNGKNIVIEKLKQLPGTFKRLGCLHFLGVKVTEDTLVQAVKITINNILDRVTIYDSNSPTPKMQGILFMASFRPNENTTVTVGTNPDLSYLEDIKDDIPINSIIGLINSFLTMLSNEYNLITNKELLIYYLGIFATATPDSHLDKVINILFSFASGTFEVSPLDRNFTEMASSPFSSFKMNMGKPVDLIAQSLESLSRYYAKMTDDKKAIFRNLVLDYINHNEDKIRINCAKCLRVIENVDLDLGILFYSLLFDKSELVRALAIDSFANIGISIFHHSIALSVLHKLEKFSYEDSPKDVLTAIAYNIKILHKDKETLNEEINKILNQIKNILRESKYFSVRNVFASS